MLRNQREWIEYYKQQEFIRFDYRLAQIWQVSRAKISQYKSGRLRLPLQFQIIIADALQIEVIEIIASIEMHRKPNDTVKRAYFMALKKTIGARMSLQCKSGFKHFR